MLSAMLIVSLAVPRLLWAQNLDNPQPGSSQSGVGLISGFVCEADVIEVEIDGGRFPAAYGSSRGDTLGVCGDINNGFGLVFNWNLAGDGPHTVRAFADGVEFANVQVLVATLQQEFLTGVRPGPDPDRVLATILFTDIVGSTETTAKMGDRRWKELLGAYYASGRKELERFRGREVKTMGDGLLATFDGPARAIRCACAMREAARPLGIAMRAGLHTGECEVMGEDIAGIAVDIGARVAAEATSGEVLVSSTVKDLVAGSGLEFEDRGSHRLKGVPDDWQLFAVSGGA